jgi:hypothetical protein
MSAPLRLKLFLLRGTHDAPLFHPLLSLLLVHPALVATTQERSSAAERGDEYHRVCPPTKKAVRRAVKDET